MHLSPVVVEQRLNARARDVERDGARIDEDGYIKIADRTKDLIKSGGEWISSVDIENALMGHPSISEAAVVAIPHPKWDERPLAAIVLKPGLNVCPSELKKMLLEKFAKWWVPEAYEFIKEIPKTSVNFLWTISTAGVFCDATKTFSPNSLPAIASAEIVKDFPVPGGP